VVTHKKVFKAVSSATQLCPAVHQRNTNDRTIDDAELKTQAQENYYGHPLSHF